MLIKKELEQVAVLACPVFKDDSKRDLYRAAAHIVELERSGRVLVVDFYHAADKELVLRFFSDAKSFQMFVFKMIGYKKRADQGEWSRAKCEGVFSYDHAASSKKDLALVDNFLKDSIEHYYHKGHIDGIVDGFISEYSRNRREKANDAKAELQRQHFEMFPAYPDGLADYCERFLFGYTYIFISKLNGARRCKHGTSGGLRDAVCGRCGHKFKVGRDEKPGKQGVCKKCGASGVYRGSWNPSVNESTKICITHRIDGQLLLRWTDVERRFNGGKCGYHFDDYCYNLHLSTSKGSVLYAYKYQSVMGWGYDWYRKRNGDANYENTYIYTENLDDVFGQQYYHVNLRAGIKDGVKVEFTRLLDNLKNVPAAEYLFKLGMISFTSSSALKEHINCSGRGFTGVLGVSKQYLPLYQKYDIDPYEHDIIKASDRWISEDMFLKYRALRPQNDFRDITRLLKEMSFERFVNYFTKQKAMYAKSVALCALTTVYRDYISMSKDLEVDLSHKSVRFPKDIKAAHDQILERFNEMKAEIQIKKAKTEDKAFRQAIRKVYKEKGISQYSDGELCIVLPMGRSDFIVEGQSLKHCVGGSLYSDGHKSGKRMIFFIRKADDPKRPFFTLEMDMKEYSIIQLRGLCNCAPTPDIQKFVKAFLKQIKPKNQGRKSA